MKPSERLENFEFWVTKAKNSLKIPCINDSGNTAYFKDYDGIIMVGFGDEGGCEPDKDALHFDKDDLPKVIAFLQNALDREKSNETPLV